jgi:hypothetical protein
VWAATGSLTVRLAHREFAGHGSYGTLRIGRYTSHCLQWVTTCRGSASYRGFVAIKRSTSVSIRLSKSAFARTIS